MVFRSVGVGFAHDDHTVPITGDEGLTVLQSDQKMVTRTGAAKQQADFDINKDVITDGDFESGPVDIGGTSGIAIALDSAQNNSFEVLVDLLDDSNNVRGTVDSADYADLQGTTVTEVVPVFSDKIEVRVTDRSGGANNDISGSLNANIGTPTNVSTTIQSGEVQVKGADNDFFADAPLNQSVAGSDVSMLTYLARALDSQGLDEFVSRQTDSQGTQIDPLTQDVTQTASNDELRTRLYGVDTTATLRDVNIAELGNAASGSDVSLLTYLARALASQATDELRVDTSPSEPLDVSSAEVDVDINSQTLSQVATDLAQIGGQAQSAVDVADKIDQIEDALASVATDALRVNLESNNAGTLAVEQQTPVGVEDSQGTQVDPLTQDATTAVGNTELRTDQQAGEISNLRADAEFVASYRATGVADTATAFTVVVSNPGGSGVDTVVTPTFATGGAAYLDVAEDVSISTSGTALSTLPRDTMSGSSPAATIERDGSYTVNGTTITSLLPGTSRSGGPTAMQGSESPATGAHLLEPGDSVYYEVVNQSGSSADFDVELSLVER